MIAGASTRRLDDVVRLVAALIVLVVTGLIASRGVPSFEERWFDGVNGLTGAIEPVLWAPMQLGSLFGPVVVAVGAWVAWRQWRPVVGALVVGMVAWQAARMVKDIIERGRPGDELDQIVRRPGTPLDGLGYVSGHTAVAFALATVVSPYLPRLGRWVAYGLAAVVAIARIHNGAHLPLDTVGGAALGVAVGLVYRLAVGVPVGPVERADPVGGD